MIFSCSMIRPLQRLGSVGLAGAFTAGGHALLNWRNAILGLVIAWIVAASIKDEWDVASLLRALLAMAAFSPYALAVWRHRHTIHGAHPLVGQLPAERRRLAGMLAVSPWLGKGASGAGTCSVYGRPCVCWWCVIALESLGVRLVIGYVSCFSCGECSPRRKGIGGSIPVGRRWPRGTRTVQAHGSWAGCKARVPCRAHHFPRGLHPWHDIPTGRRPPDELTAVIEIPTNERNKYELDKTLGVYRLDRVLHSAVHYPGDYGFLPRTLGEDGDPLDVLVLMTIPVFTGCLVDARPDRPVPPGGSRGRGREGAGGGAGRPLLRGSSSDLEDIPAHYLKEIEHFFQVYKDLEGTRTETRGFEGAAAAREAVVRAMELYESKFARRAE